MNTTTYHNYDLIKESNASQVIEIIKENRNLKNVLMECVMALNVAQAALANCKADVGYSSKQTKAAIAINTAITKYNELVQQ